MTTELADFKEKYREVVDLLNDTREELKQAKRKSYPGLGQHNVTSMFTGSPSDGATPDPSKKGNCYKRFTIFYPQFAIAIFLIE